MEKLREALMRGAMPEPKPVTMKVSEEALEERRAVFEYDGGFPRVLAEWLALLLYIKRPDNFSEAKWRGYTDVLLMQLDGWRTSIPNCRLWAITDKEILDLTNSDILSLGQAAQVLLGDV